MRDDLNLGLEDCGSQRSIHHFIFESCLEIVATDEPLARSVIRAGLIGRPISSAPRADEGLLRMHGAERTIVDMTFVILQNDDLDVDDTAGTEADPRHFTIGIEATSRFGQSGCQYGRDQQHQA